MSPRAGLSRDRIAEAALGLLREQPDARLTMRRIADHFGVDAMALYRHVRDKDDLLQAMSDATLRQGLGVALPAGVGRTGRATAEAAATALYEHLISHPERIPIVAASTTTTVAARYSLAIASRLIADGVDEVAAVRGIRTVVAYVLGAALLTLEPDQGTAAIDVDVLVQQSRDDGIAIDASTVDRLLAYGMEPDFPTGLTAILDAFLSGAPATRGRGNPTTAT